MPSLVDPSYLYILKENDSTWMLLRYSYFTLRSTDVSHYYDNPIIESVVMESLTPQKIGWKSYINNLHLDSLWNLETESAIKGKRFIVGDGQRYLVELGAKGKYKYLFYTQPDYFQKTDVNHKKFLEFQENLTAPVMHNGIFDLH